MFQSVSIVIQTCTSILRLVLANWAGNHAYRAAVVHRPASLDQLRELVAGAGRLRALGSRHSFSEIADSDELVSLDGLPAEVAVDHGAGTVSVGAGLRYGELAEALKAEGVALANLASLPHISVGGAVATATHGSGDANGNLATAVAGGPERWTAEVDPGWTVAGRPNGGYLLALATRAALEAAGQPHPLAVSAHFLAPADLGPAELEVTGLRAGRTLATTSVTLVQEGAARMAALVTAHHAIGILTTLVVAPIGA